MGNPTPHADKAHTSTSASDELVRAPGVVLSWLAHVRAAALVSVLGLSAMGCGGGGPSEEDVHRSQTEYQLGVGLYEEQNIAGAFQHLQESIRLDPENAEAHAVLGTLYMLRQDVTSSERHLRLAIQANESLGRSGLPALTPDVRNTLGVLYINAHRYDEAVVELRLATGDLMNRTPHLAWGNLGWAYIELHDWPQATESLRQAVRLQPLFCTGWYRLGQVGFARGEAHAADASAGDAEGFAHAEEALTHALEVDDEGCRALQEAWLLRGETRARLGRRDEAIHDFERCIELAANTEAGRACAGFLSTGG